MKKITKYILLVIIIFFLSLYFSKYSSNYYEDKSSLTEEAIRNYEKDLKSGKDIVASNYIVEEKNYNNKASIIGLSISHFIEKLVDKGFQYITRYIEKNS